MSTKKKKNSRRGNRLPTREEVLEEQQRDYTPMKVPEIPKIPTPLKSRVKKHQKIRTENPEPEPVESSSDEESIAESVEEVELPPSPSPVEDIVIEIVNPIQTIDGIEMGDQETNIKMTPRWFEQERENEALTDITFPEGITDQKPFEAVARYRKMSEQKTGFFDRKTVYIKKNSTDSVIVALNEFARQYSGDLSFTRQEIPLNDNVYRTACGIANLSSTHLIATNFVPAARYTFRTTYNYETDLAKSSETMKRFSLSVATGVAEILGLPNNEYVRVTKVSKDEEDDDLSTIALALCADKEEKTQELAKQLESYAMSGFRNHKSLQGIRSGNYACEWKPLLTYLQLQVHDFAPDHNYDYNRMGIAREGMRGNQLYHVPIGWYRHAIDLTGKYLGSDDRWLGCDNVPGEWPIAYYGTHTEVDGFTKKRAPDLMRDDAVGQIGEKANVPGFYVSTRCNGGAHPAHTKTFELLVEKNKLSRFRVVFQCRVKPKHYTVHTCPQTGAAIWRVTSPDAVRPYGVLVRSRKQRRNKQGDIESDDD